MKEVAIQVDNLFVDFDNITAVAGVSFEIQRGHIYGLVGPNGAGKTTTLKVLSTLQEPTIGKVEIAGFPLQEKNLPDIRRNIGFMPDFSPVYDELTVLEFLEFYAAAYHLPGERRSICMDRLRQVQLEGRTDSFVGDLSRGMKQRLTLAKTLLHEPQILLLDEPASGLDPLSRKQLYDILIELQKRRHTVLISSHILAEMDKFCTAVLIMEKGKIVSVGTMQEITAGEKRRIHVQLAENHVRAEGIMREFTGVEMIQRDGDLTWEVTIEGDMKQLASYNKYLLESGLLVCGFQAKKTSIEEIFLQSGAKDVS